MFNFLCGAALMKLWKDPQCNQLLLPLGAGAFVLGTCSFWHHFYRFKNTNPRWIQTHDCKRSLSWSQSESISLSCLHCIWGSFFFLFFLNFIYLFIDWLIDWWLCWVFVSVRGLSLVAASGGHCSSRCAGLSLSRPVLLRSTGSRRAGSAGVVHGPSCSAACGIFPDQGSNPCPLHWQADSQPLRHQGSPVLS